MSVALLSARKNVFIALVRFGHGYCPAEYTVLIRCARRASRLLPSGPLLASWPLPAWLATVKATDCMFCPHHQTQQGNITTTYTLYSYTAPELRAPGRLVVQPKTRQTAGNKSPRTQVAGRHQPHEHMRSSRFRYRDLSPVSRAVTARGHGICQARPSKPIRLLESRPVRRREHAK